MKNVIRIKRKAYQRQNGNTNKKIKKSKTKNINI